MPMSESLTRGTFVGLLGGWHLFSKEPSHRYAISQSSSLFLHGFWLHMQDVDNVNTIIAPALVGKLSKDTLLGMRQTILETNDGGNTQAPGSIPSAEDEDFNYQFNSTSFKGKEGWIVRKSSILLYTSDARES
ncbi:hypothetical protein JHK87_039917 [Glycine soja]|nr:hypothetical protein JHK87_039917 [Glycine soja]